MGERGETRGRQAERLVADRLRAVVPPTTSVLANVHWLLRDHRQEKQGEADIVVADPDRGILVLEVKSGEVRRDGSGTWWLGSESLDRSPFRQASDSRFALIRKLYELPDWPAGLRPIAGEGVAFPDVDLDTMRGRLGLLGLDADHDLIADQSMFRGDEDGRAELRAFVDRAFEHWGGGAGTPPGAHAIELLNATFTEPIELRSQLRNELVDAERETVRLTDGQAAVLRAMRGNRRVEIRGGAGTGKTLFAIDTATRLARQGFETLLVCFNSPLARMLTDETAPVAAGTGRLTVATFHQLCEDLGREAGTLPPKPANPVPPEWFAETLPAALDAAIAAMPGGGRYHAIVVDEGQDFEPGWLLSLDELLVSPGEDVLYVFHDPAQAIYRDDSVGQLGLETVVELDFNCRNALPIHRVVERFAEGGLASTALRTDGRAPELIEATDARATVDALGHVLHRLRSIDGEQVNPWDIAVLTGVSLDQSAVWRHRRYGNEVLENPAVDGAGRPLGLAATQVPPMPTDAIACDSIRRFKGLERPVVVLADWRDDDPWLRRKLYVGASRARHHLVVIAPPAVLGLLA